MDEATYLAVFNLSCYSQLALSPSHNSDGLSSGQSFASSSPATSPVCSTDSSSSSSSSCSSGFACHQSTGNSASQTAANFYANSIDWNHFLQDHNQLLAASSKQPALSSNRLELSAKWLRQQSTHLKHPTQRLNQRQLLFHQSGPTFGWPPSQSRLSLKLQTTTCKPTHDHRNHLTNGPRRVLPPPPLIAAEAHLFGEPLSPISDESATCERPRQPPDHNYCSPLGTSNKQQLDEQKQQPLEEAESQTKNNHLKHNLSQQFFHNNSTSPSDDATSNNHNNINNTNNMMSNNKSNDSNNSRVKLNQKQQQQQKLNCVELDAKSRRARGENRKCRKVYGMDQRELWCTQCKWKKACSRFFDQ